MRGAPRVAIASLPDSPRVFGFGQRLHTPREFAEVLAARNTLRGASFDLHYRRAGPGVSARLGLIVPKRLVRQAVQRNRIKRLGREAFRQLRASIPPYDVVLRFARPVREAGGQSIGRFAVWRREIEGLLRSLPMPLQ